MEHEPKYSKRRLGYMPIGRRSLYGYSVRCSCGWSQQTNENKRHAISLFKDHSVTEWERWKATFRALNKCMFPEREYNHKVACREPATHLSKDRLPSCESHQNFYMRKEWKGFIEGA